MNKIPVCFNYTPGDIASRPLFSVWSADDLFHLRDSYRVLSDPVGTLQPHATQNRYLTLPAILTAEQVALGLQHSFIVIHDTSHQVFRKMTENQIQLFNSQRIKSLTQSAQLGPMQHGHCQQALLTTNTARISTSSLPEPTVESTTESKAGNAITDPGDGHGAKKRKQSPSSSSDPDEELIADASQTQINEKKISDSEQKQQAIPDLSSKQQEKYLYHSLPKNTSITKSIPLYPIERESTTLLNDLDDHNMSRDLMNANKPIDDEAPMNNQRYALVLEYLHQVQDSPRYQVLLDLWQHGYYLASGFKFGVDFAAYALDPHLVHSAVLVKVMADSQSRIPVKNFITSGRLALTTNKKVCYAFVDQHGQVQYVGFQWHESLP